MGYDVVIIGGGPSGLAAAYEAAGQGAAVSVFERLDIVGGLARTIAFRGSRFDIGAHRFFTKNAEVQQLFVSLLGEEAVRVARFTRILNDGRYFDYPLTPLNAMMGVGLASGVAISASYAAARLRAARAPLPIVRIGSSIALAVVSLKHSSRATQKRSGVFRAAKSARTGRRSGLRA